MSPTAACLGGLASTAVETGAKNYDGVGLVTGTFFGVRANTVGQTFSRKFSAIDYKIQKQQLHREDIRDLVELTTARMDIFHIVGTLLLAFCMAWYTDNAILAGSLPTWFSDIFLISNFAAVGYLMLCVWLAMYAAIAARSIGIRLLTSYARLSFPTKEALDDIKAPIFFNSMDYVKKKMRSLGSSSSSAGTVESASGEVVAMEGTLPQEEPNEELTEDDQQHFRRILREMPKWLIYDIWSRVCMTMGINQMLQALSYYILGILWEKSAILAVMSFMGINYLSYVMLWLDLGDNINSFWELLGVLTLNVLPPGLAAALLAWNTLLDSDQIKIDDSIKVWLSTLATVCFWAHGAWLTYLMLQFRNAGSMGSKYKAGSYAQVLEWVDFHPVQKNVYESVMAKCKALEDKLDEAMKADEASAVTVLQDRWKLQGVYDTAVKALQTFKAYRPISHVYKKTPVQSPLAHAIQEYAEHVTTNYKVWSDAGELAIAFSAMSSPLVQERLTEEQKKLVNEREAAFRKHCTSLGLGLGSDKTMPQEPGLLAVHFESPAGSEWVDVVNMGVLSSKPWGVGRVIEFPAVLEQMAAWESSARMLYTTRKALPAHKATIDAVPPPFDPEAPGHKSPVQEWNGGHEPGVWKKSVDVPRPMEQADWLPQRVFNWFTRIVVIWWFSAGLLHAARVLLTANGAFGNYDAEADTAEEAVLRTLWPQPARLFRVASMHCNDQHMWVSSKYALFRAPRSAATDQLTLEEIGGHSGVGAVLCQKAGDESGCHVLSHKEPGARWTMSLLRQAGHSEATEVPLPESWSVMSGVWAADSCTAASSCNRAFLAGWDGTTISAATLTWDKEQKSWALKQRYDLDPAVGMCGGRRKGDAVAFWTFGMMRSRGCVAGNRRHGKSYGEVRSLQMGAEGRTLTVLLDDGAVDIWDLTKGLVAERIHLKNNYTSMCQNGRNLLFSRESADGPYLASVALPQQLAKLMDGNDATGSEQVTASAARPALASPTIEKGETRAQSLRQQPDAKSAKRGASSSSHTLSVE